ncbi:MAG TPA: LLM class flavin-dependent oxidoreductase [Dehalococcoidia bacterium]|nr:LLM class flavin-dependent oxidoreductase [Dehalococcoidia bacterium]
MKIGVSLTTSHPLRQPARQVGAQLVERARAIRAAGLDSLFVGDHHATPAHYFQNVPTIARLMAETSDMMVGALYLVPLHHPVLTAEHLGTLWALAGGPFVMIAAAGDGEEQFAPFGVSVRRRPSMLEEHLTIIRELLSGRPITYHGRYHQLTDVQIHPTPDASLPIWIGASARPALQRAGALGDAWLASPAAHGEHLTTQIDIYCQAASAAGRRPVLTARRDVYVGESDAEAEAAVRPVLERGYRGFQTDALIYGGPERVLAAFHELHELGFEHVLIRHIVPDQGLVLASYERLGRDVLPVAHTW